MTTGNKSRRMSTPGKYQDHHHNRANDDDLYRRFGRNDLRPLQFSGSMCKWRASAKGRTATVRPRTSVKVVSFGVLIWVLISLALSILMYHQSSWRATIAEKGGFGGGKQSSWGIRGASTLGWLATEERRKETPLPVASSVVSFSKATRCVFGARASSLCEWELFRDYCKGKEHTVAD